METCGWLFALGLTVLGAALGAHFRGLFDARKENRAALLEIHSLLLKVKAVIEERINSELGLRGFVPGPTPLDKWKCACNDLDEKVKRLRNVGRLGRLLGIRKRRTRFIDDLVQYLGDEQRTDSQASLNRVCRLIGDLESLLGIQKSAQSPPSP
jgi:hypothetical protein